MRLLLISNSTNYGEEYLGWPRQNIKNFLSTSGIKNILFIPYAGVGLSAERFVKSYDLYEDKVNKVFNELGYRIISIHKDIEPVQAIKDAEAIAVGGGNTFHLVHMMQKIGIMDVIKERVLEGIPYIGWSAGSNVVCPSLMTTNDMPIIQPESFRCISLVNFQINPHYLDASAQGHAGETREQRIEEFLIVNKDMPVVGLREGTLLQVEEDHISLKGARPMRYFRFGTEPQEFKPGSDINFLLK